MSDTPTPPSSLSQVSGERMFHDFHTFDLKVGLSKDSILSSCSVVLSSWASGFCSKRKNLHAHVRIGSYDGVTLLFCSRQTSPETNVWKSCPATQQRGFGWWSCSFVPAVINIHQSRPISTVRWLIFAVGLALCHSQWIGSYICHMHCGGCKDATRVVTATHLTTPDIFTEAAVELLGRTIPQTQTTGCVFKLELWRCPCYFCSCCWLQAFLIEMRASTCSSVWAKL